MKKNSFFYLILSILGTVDAWLLAHPNLIGRMGILFYKYDMIKTTPRAFMTVFATIFVASMVAHFMTEKVKKPTSTIITILLLVVSIGLTIQTYFKFSAGTYAMTGAGFKVGAVLLPIILAIIFGKTMVDIFSKKDAS